jgi:hypothetical protein
MTTARRRRAMTTARRRRGTMTARGATRAAMTGAWPHAHVRTVAVLCVRAFVSDARAGGARDVRFAYT